MNENEIVDLLLGRPVLRVAEAQREGVVPNFLVAVYFRENAAREAAQLPQLSTRVIAALLRAAFTDEEEDVRAAARHTLITRNSELGDVVHYALLLDSDADVRESAIDEALEVADEDRRHRLMRQAILELKVDECDRVRTRALGFANDPNPKW